MFMRSLPVLIQTERNKNPEPTIRATQPPEQHYGQTGKSKYKKLKKTEISRLKIMMNVVKMEIVDHVRIC